MVSQWRNKVPGVRKKIRLRKIYFKIFNIAEHLEKEILFFHLKCMKIKIQLKEVRE